MRTPPKSKGSEQRAGASVGRAKEASTRNERSSFGCGKVLRSMSGTKRADAGDGTGPTVTRAVFAPTEVDCPVKIPVKHVASRGSEAAISRATRSSVASSYTADNGTFGEKPIPLSARSAKRVGKGSTLSSLVLEASRISDVTRASPHGNNANGKLSWENAADTLGVHTLWDRPRGGVIKQAKLARAKTKLLEEFGSLD